MHLFFITDGVQHAVDMFKTQMQGLKFKRKIQVKKPVYQKHPETNELIPCYEFDEKGALKRDEKGVPIVKHEFVDEPQIIWGSLRPVELWSYTFPEEYKDDVLTALKIDEEGKIHPWNLTIPQKALQVAMGLKPIKYKKKDSIDLSHMLPRTITGTGIKTNMEHAIETDGVAVYPIGIKEDKQGHWKDEIRELKQEMI